MNLDSKPKVSPTWFDDIPITEVYRFRIDFKLPMRKDSSTSGGDDFEYEAAWRNRVDSLMSELHVVGNDADELKSCDGIDVCGVDPYVLAEFSDIQLARATMNSLCELIVYRGGVVVTSESQKDDDLETQSNMEQASA